MYGLDILVKEHDNIQRFNKVVRKICISMMDGNEPDLDDFQKVLAFARNYADKQHHGKEEKILFAIMEDKLGTVAEKLIHNGMLVEHDLGRLHMMQLEAALNSYKENPTKEVKLDILLNASGYTDLLERHIGKENTVVFSFAERSLKEDIWEVINEQTKNYEMEATKNQIQNKYIGMLEELEKKYM